MWPSRPRLLSTQMRSRTAIVVAADGKRALGTTSQEHQGDRYCLFIDKHTLSQEMMNGFQKVEKIKAAPSNDLDLPERPKTHDAIPFHDWDFRLADESAFRGLAHKTLGSSHPSCGQRIRSGLSIFIELTSEHSSKFDVNRWPELLKEQLISTYSSTDVPVWMYSLACT